MKMNLLDLYTDGGILGKNPSKHGGTFACCVIEKKKQIKCNSGLILPKDYGMSVVGNNMSELVAALEGLSLMPKDWDGNIYTDSLITLYRITTSDKFNGVPNSLRLRTLDLRRNRKWKVVHLGGHPTKLELDKGFRKDGKPVSVWNCWCDETCQQLARDFFDGR